MAIDQLGLYNDALLILGQRKLASLTEDREPRYRLDDAYTTDAIRTCLELVKPQFASKTVKLSTPATGDNFDYSHTFPSDYTVILHPFSDKKLDQDITRFIIQGKTLEADYDTVYLRYISDAYVITDWDASFFRVVAAYLAKETGTRLSPDEFAKVEGTFDKRVEEALKLEAAKAPRVRSSATTVVMTNAWRKVYNDALLILGLDEITSNTDDSNRRTKLDRTLDSGLVSDLLEDTGWQFGMESSQMSFDPSAEPSWGYQRAIQKPDNMHRLDGIYTDSYMRTPLKLYKDEGDYWFCEYDEIYISYITTDFLVNPDGWPTYFRRLVAAKMAKDAASALRREGADVENALATFTERESSGKSIDAMQSPPHKFAEGNWTRSRFRGGYRGRP